jgi:hypothetical protein
MGSKAGALAFAAASLATAFTAWAVPAATVVRAPLACSRGPRDQYYVAAVTVPSVAPEGSTYTLRIDNVSSGVISHVGLRYIHDMSTDYVLPTGTTFVPGSAHFVAHTGSANVLPGARVWHEDGVVHVVLPAHVDNGSSYTPPSLELALKVVAPAGARLSFKLLQIRVTANAFLVGNLETHCDPVPKPLVLGTTLVGLAAPAP